MFIDNVFDQTNEKEMDLICNQVISKIIEKLLTIAKPEIRMKFAKIIQKEMRIICTDPYGSHVLETIMHIFMEVISCKDEKLDPDYVEFCHAWICSVCQFAFNNVEDFVSDIYASHILRTSLQCVSGVDVGVLLMKSNRSRKHLDGKEELKAIKDLKSLSPKHSAEFLRILRDFAERFVGWPQLHGK